MRLLLGMFILLFLGSNVCYGQTKRDDRKNKTSPKVPIEQENAQKEFDNLPADQKKVLLEVGKKIQDEQQEKAKKQGSAKAKKDEKPKPTAEVPIPVAKSAEPKPVPATTSDSKTSKTKTTTKTDKVKVEKTSSNSKTKVVVEAEAEEALGPKIQRRPKGGKKFTEEEIKEFSLYTERISSDPDSADVAILLPKSSPETASEDRLKKAVQLVEKRFPDKALSVLQELTKKDPKNSNYNYWLGRAYLASYNSRTKSIPYLIKASEHTDYSYLDKYPEKNNLAPVNSLFYLGMAYHLDGNLEKAERHFRLFASIAKAGDPLIKQAELRLQQIAVAEKLVKTPKKNVSVTNAGPSVNSPYADYSPFVTVDGTELFFTTARPTNDANPSTQVAIDAEYGKYFDDIYVANLDPDGKWVAAKPINLDSAGNEVVRGISSSSKVMWLYQDNLATADIYESAFAFDTWQTPVAIVQTANTLKWGKNFNIDADRSIVYFASSELGGIGGSDIFYSVKNDDGTWSEPSNVGPNVNTIHDEDMPFLHPNKKVLYYSSNSARSMGGYDVFRSMLVGQWQTGENMGYPINTVEDDLHFSMAPDGRSAYYSRRGIDSKGDLDIYQVNFFSNTAAFAPRLQASFKIELKKAPVKKGKKTQNVPEVEPDNNEIVLTNVLTKEQFIYIPNLRTGNFSVYLDPCTKYNIEYRKNGQPVRSEDFIAPCDMQTTNGTLLFDPLGTNTPTSPRTANMPLIDKSEANLQGYSWQLQRLGSPETNMSYQDINYLNAKGEIIKSVKIDSEGIFQFEDIPDDQDYIFELRVPESLCGQYRVILMKDRKKVPAGASYSVICYQ